MKKIFVAILKFAVIAFLSCWIVIIFVDYFRVKQNKNLMFCLHETEKNYEDGSTYICNGLGYKFIKYNRECLKATEFGPFLIKERDCSNN